MTVAAIIPTIPGRETQLAEAVASVHAQTHPVSELQVQRDQHHRGPAWARNEAIARTDSEWLAFLDDDDVWFPHHLETLLGHADGADVVYPDCEVTGDSSLLLCNADYNPAALERGNYIPVTVLIRRSAFDLAGGFNPDDRYEDWQLWLRLTRLGATFRHVPVVTWRYRFGITEQRTFA